MSDPDTPATLSFQVLADPTGRRRRRLAVAGRIATTALGLWLAALTLGGLGLQPLAGLPVVGDIGAGNPEPPALPERVRSAVARHATIAPSTPALQVPAWVTVPAPLPSPPLSTAPTATTRAPARTTPSSTPGPTSTSPSATAPGQTRTAPGQTKTAPGQTKTAPGKTKTAPVPPAATTPQPKRNGKTPPAIGTTK